MVQFFIVFMAILLFVLVSVVVVVVEDAEVYWTHYHHERFIQIVCRILCISQKGLKMITKKLFVMVDI